MKLPNAPLVEVVFELRWSVETIPGMAVLGFDPAFSQFSEAFSNSLKREGFTAREDFGGGAPPVPYGIMHRYKKKPNSPFPLYQIGHGIFACNMATEYEWQTFQKLVADGLDLVFKNHPGSFGKSPKILSLELRYVDVYDEALLKHKSAERFIRENTRLGYTGLEFLDSNIFDKTGDSIFKIHRTLKDDPLSTFHVDIGPAKSGEDRSVLVTSRFVKSATPLNMGMQPRSIRKNILEWIDIAHGVTSPFFKDFLSEDLMAVFSKKPAKKK